MPPVHLFTILDLVLNFVVITQIEHFGSAAAYCQKGWEMSVRSCKKNLPTN